MACRPGSAAVLATSARWSRCDCGRARRSRFSKARRKAAAAARGGSKLPRRRASSAGCRPSISMRVIPATACERRRRRRSTSIIGMIFTRTTRRRNAAHDGFAADHPRGRDARLGLGRRLVPRPLGQASLAHGRGVPSGGGSHRFGAFRNVGRGADGLVVRFAAGADEPVVGPGADGGGAWPRPAAGQQDRPLRRHQAASGRGPGDA